LPHQARALAERFTRSLDPRICPLLRRALPYAWVGVSVCPDDGADLAVLIPRAQAALERARNAGMRPRKSLFSRRRVGASVLRPAVVG
jgi:hypothetical protein